MPVVQIIDVVTVLDAGVFTVGSVLVIVDRRVPSEKLLQVVDQCRLAGATDVGVATEKEVGQ